MNLDRPDSLSMILNDELISPVSSPVYTPGGTKLGSPFEDDEGTEAYYDHLVRKFKHAAIEIDQLEALQNINKFVQRASSFVKPKVFLERLEGLSNAMVTVGEGLHGYTLMKGSRR